MAGMEKIKVADLAIQHTLEEITTNLENCLGRTATLLKNLQHFIDVNRKSSNLEYDQHDPEVRLCEAMVHSNYIIIFTLFCSL